MGVQIVSRTKYMQNVRNAKSANCIFSFWTHISSRWNCFIVNIVSPIQQNILFISDPTVHGRPHWFTPRSTPFVRASLMNGPLQNKYGVPEFLIFFKHVLSKNGCETLTFSTRRKIHSSKKYFIHPARPPAPHTPSCTVMIFSWCASEVELQ